VVVIQFVLWGIEVCVLCPGLYAVLQQVRFKFVTGKFAINELLRKQVVV
jgi:hypothetical protein